MKQENYFIDFLRFIFSMCILFYHSWIFAGEFGNGFFNSGYLAVDFYFIVTGFLMMNSIYKKNYEKVSVLNGSFNYLFNKVKKLLPSLIAAFFVGVIFVYGKSCVYEPSLLVSDKLLPELLQLGIFGYDMTVNSSWWYISAMIFSMALLCPLAIKYKDDYCKYIAPLIIVFTLGFIKMNNIIIDDPVNISYFLRNGFYQALIFIPLGNIAYVVTDIIKRKEYKKTKLNILSCLEIGIYIMLFLNMHYLFIDRFLFVLLMVFNISLTFSNITFSSKLFKHSIWKKLGDYGFYIYLCNISIRTFMINNYLNLGLSYKALFFKFVILSCLTGLLLYVGVEIIYKKIFMVSKSRS